ARGGGAQRADQAEVELRAVRAEPVERLEAADRLEDEVAPAVGWQLADLDAGEGRASRLDPLRAVGGEVRGRERSRRAPRDGALVEALDVLERARELGLHEGPVGEEE